MDSKETLKKFWKNKKVFITGHTGFKGSWLALLLSEIGAEVTGFSLPPLTNPSHFDLINLRDKINESTQTNCGKDMLNLRHSDIKHFKSKFALCAMNIASSRFSKRELHAVGNRLALRTISFEIP